MRKQNIFKIILLGLALSLNACATYQTDMNSDIPNENDNSINSNMPPLENSNINMN